MNMAKNLTEKQRKFAQAKAAGMSHRDAAITAGYAVAGAAVQGSQLMKLPHVKAEVARMKKGFTRSERKAAGEKEAEREPGRLRDRYDSPLDLMLDTMNNPNMPVSVRFEAAKQALPYTSARLSDAGKKAKKTERAQELSKPGSGRAPIAPPTRTRMN